jgi:hypothetical protein
MLSVEERRFFVVPWEIRDIDPGERSEADPASFADDVPTLRETAC